MTIFQGYDGELRLYEYGNNGTTYHIEILFCEMDFTGPIARPYPSETLILDRGRWDTNVRFREENDMVRFEPMPFSFSCRLADTVNSQVLVDWISGVTIIGGSTQIYSFKGKTQIDGITCPDFVGNDRKFAYTAEILWDGSSNDLGLKYNEVYFRPEAQRITESADGLVLDCEGLIYGAVTRITSFTITSSSIV